MRQRVTGVIVREGKILLIHRIKRSEDYYTLPGGGVEEGESLTEALQREMREELSLDIVKHRELFRIDTEERKEIFYLILDFMGVPGIGGPERERMSKENQYIITWCDLDRVDGFVGRYLGHEVIRKIREGALLE